jgi:DNA-binding FadR family transcriptional regulator
MTENPPFRAAPIAANGTLADRVTEVLMQKIKHGEVAVNTRLPSESELANQFAVSRTVIREAISRLKSEGLVEARQGKGTIVLASTTAAPFRIDPEVKESLEAVLRVVELRRGLETEMTALAAQRRTDAQNNRIQQALRDIDAAVLAGRDGVEEDLAFHAAISEASGNPLYTSLLQFLSQFLRDAIRVGRINESGRNEFMGQLNAEHRAIADAIDKQDIAAGRIAAWQHLDNVATRMHSVDERFWESEGGTVARRLAKTGVLPDDIHWLSGNADTCQS